MYQPPYQRSPVRSGKLYHSHAHSRLRTNRNLAFGWNLMLSFLLILTIACDSCNNKCGVFGLGWPWGGSSPRIPQREQLTGHLSLTSHFEVEDEDTFVSHRGLIQEAQVLSKSRFNKVDGSSERATCWQNAYRQLYSSCRDILSDEEKKCRLAYQMTICFLKMTGWPAPPKCPENRLIRTCTEKFDEHTHALYLAFFVDTTAMCHHLQSEAFKRETEVIVNELKDSGLWVLEKLEDVKVRSENILKSTKEQSAKLEQKLMQVESASQILLEKSLALQERVQSTQHSVDNIHKQQDEIHEMQSELKNKNVAMMHTLEGGLHGLEQAADKTYLQLDNISHGQQRILQQQHQLADALAGELHSLKESALKNLDELKNSQASAMEETRFSLKGLADGAKKAQVSFDAWRVEMDERSDRLVKGSEVMLSAQEAFVSRQGSILSTLDRLFSLYDSILFESRALKVFLFYGISLVFIQVLSSAKQTYHARMTLYMGLCSSLILEVYLMRAYGSALSNQQWIQSSSYRVRGAFGVFTVLVILYCVCTYRDISWTNYQLLIDLNNRFNELASKLNYVPSHHAATQQEHSVKKDDHTYGFVGRDCNLFSLRKSASPRSLTQVLASKILRHARKLTRKKRVKCRMSESKPDALRSWMASRGLDTAVLDSSDDDNNDVDFVLDEADSGAIAWCHPTYMLRSQCQQQCTHKHRVYPCQ